jgi:uncharacterized protein
MTTHTQAKPAGTPTWVDLMTPDIDAARAFYHHLFGWEYDSGGPEYGGYTTARLGVRSAAGMMPHVSPMVVGTFGSMAVLEDPTGATFSFWQAGQHIGSQVHDEVGAAAWYELYSPNAHEARDFYSALLGAIAEPTPGGPPYYVLKRGDEMLCAVMQIDPSWGAFQPQWVTYFGVADADEAVAVATTNGGKALSAIDPTPFGRIAALMDPHGAYFKIVEVGQG